MSRRVFSPDGDRYLEVRKGEDAQFYVHELDSNHEQLMVSEGYVSKRNAWRAARNSFREFFPQPEQPVAPDFGDGRTVSAVCHYCDSGEREMRPYGPGGAWVCHPCAIATPERRAQTEAAFGALLDGASAISTTGIVAIGESDGPRPFNPEEAR